MFEPVPPPLTELERLVLDADCDIQLGFDQVCENVRVWLRSEISVRRAPAPQAARNTARGLRCPTRMTGRSSTAQCVAFGDFSLGMAWARQGGSRARRHKHRRCEIFVVCERRSMPSSRGAKKAAQRRPTLKPASLTSKRSSNGLLHSRRGRRGVSSRHRTNQNQVAAPAPRRRGLPPRRQGRAHLSGSGRPSASPAPAADLHRVPLPGPVGRGGRRGRGVRRGARRVSRTRWRCRCTALTASGGRAGHDVEVSQGEGWELTQAHPAHETGQRSRRQPAAASATPTHPRVPSRPASLISVRLLRGATQAPDARRRAKTPRATGRIPNSDSAVTDGCVEMPPARQ